MRRNLYGAIGALLGISVFRKVYNELVFITNVSAGDFTSKYCINTLSILFSWRFLINFGLLNFLLVCGLLIPRFCRWLIFGGNLNEFEIKSIKEKFHYTLFEFIMGLMVLRHVDGTKVDLTRLLKYAGLFICVVLIKSFHYLSVIRVKSFVNNDHNRIKHTLKMALGMGMLITVDLLLIYKFTRDDYNTLSVIFGFEILNISPLIILSGLNFLIALVFPINTISISNGRGNSIMKSKIILDFLMNLARFSMFLIYTWFFNLHFTFPVHIIPSSYQCLRILLTKTKSLIAYKRNELNFKKFDNLLEKVDIDQFNFTKGEKIPINNSLYGNCFCLEELNPQSSDLRILDCHHVFHYDCLKWWLVKSQTCPVCRNQVILHQHSHIKVE